MAVCLVLARPTDAQAQLLYSFETGLEGWGASGFSNSDLISVGTSTAGATEGVQSMAIETGPTFGWDVNTSVNPGDTTGVYNAFNTVASNLGQYTLDFDVTLTGDSFANVSAPGNYFLINVAVNSDSPNFPQKYNVTPNLQGLTGTFPVSIPMTDLPVAQSSSYYQLTIGSNSDHVNGLGGEGVTYFVDNIRFTELPQLVEETIFSWETPDDPGTPGINEQYEGVDRRLRRRSCSLSDVGRRHGRQHGLADRPAVLDLTELHLGQQVRGELGHESRSGDRGDRS